MRILLVSALLTLTPTLPGCRPEAGRPAAGAPATSRPVSAQETPPVTARRVWSGEGVDFMGSPTPDGRGLTYTDWTTGDLALRDVVLGVDRHITSASDRPTGNPEGSFSFTERSVVSPDGQTVAFTWFDGERYRLRLIGIDGEPGPTLVVQDDATSYFEPRSWSPDGARLSVVFQRRDGSMQIAVLPVAGGPPKVLKSLDWRTPQGLHFSPDGEWIAYDFPPLDGSPARDLYLLAADGSREVRLTADEADDRVLGWLPDGAGLLFHRGSGGSEAIWRLPVLDGRAAGPAALVRPDVWRLAPIGWSRDQYFYGVTVQQGRVHTAAVDFASGRLLQEPTAVSSMQARGANADWSPDGSTVAFTVRPPGGGFQTTRLVVQSLGGGETRELPAALDYVQGLRWTRDGEGILLAMRHTGRRGIFRLDLETAAMHPVALADASGAIRRDFDLSPDGGTLYFVRGDERRGDRLVGHDLATGQERTLYPDDALNVSASPDGLSLAFTANDHEAGATEVLVMSAGGGPARVVHRETAPVFFNGFGGLPWTPDGGSLLAVRGGALSREGDMELLQIPLDGGEPRVLLEGRWLRNVRVHPNSGRLLYSQGDFSGEVWVLEGLVGGGTRAGAEP